ncbi:MAG: hypothetical protein ACRCZF_25135 [Gemmataceae bacterium]
MPFDTTIELACQAKKALGDGDVSYGSSNIRTLLRLDPSLAGIADHIAGCTNCPANAFRRPFGCIQLGAVPFPAAAERYLLARVPDSQTLPGFFALKFITELQFTGAATAAARAAGGILESPIPAMRTLETNPLGILALSTDELLDPLFRTDSKLLPWQTLAYLMIFGAVKLDDEVPLTYETLRTLPRLTTADRAKRVKLTLGTSEPGTEPARDWLKCLFVAWVRDVELKLNRIADVETRR